jgi:hypothetical protein
MTIAKLTSDDLREPDREHTQLVKLNELVDQANETAGRRVTFRPGDPSPGEYVFTDFADAMAVLDATAGLGPRVLEFDASFESPVVVPVGTYNMTHVTWTCAAQPTPTMVLLADGVSITVDEVGEGQENNLIIEGNALIILSNREGATPPFDGVNLLLRGLVVRLGNTSAAALPMFRVQTANVIRLDTPSGGFAPIAAPLIDVNAGELTLGGAAGFIGNNFATDLSVAGQGVVYGVANSDFWGDSVDQWHCPDLVSAGGEVYVDGNRPPSRYRVNPNFLGTVLPAQAGDIDSLTVDDGVVTLTCAAATFAPQGQYIIIAGATNPANDGTFPIVEVISDTVITYENALGVAQAGAVGTWEISPYEASYNEFVPVDPTTGVVTVNLPSAARSYGERVTVKDIGNSATANPITVASTYGDTVEGGSIAADDGWATWVCCGTGIWHKLS